MNVRSLSTVETPKGKTVALMDIGKMRGVASSCGLFAAP